jgi:poly-gamma-glutamate synthesis protein (capsule biosynthesis protein)
MVVQQKLLLRVAVFAIFLVSLGGGYFFIVTKKNEAYRRSDVYTVQPSEVVHIIATSTKLLFVGDMMFDRYIRKMANKYGDDHLFSCIDTLLSEQDLVIGNLEGPITTRTSSSIDTKIGSPENYYFTFPTTTATLLVRHSIKLVNIGNNHINNQRNDGIVQTKKYLTEAGVGYFGGLQQDDPLIRMRVNSTDLSFVNYNQFGGVDEDVVAKIISEEKSQGRFVVVYAHWGEEYQDVRQEIRTIAKHFADSGAAVIVGSHPHIIQSHEMFGDTPVYYSLGNFIFDQYFQKNVTEGLALSVVVAPGRPLEIKEYPVTLYKDGRTCPH